MYDPVILKGEGKNVLEQTIQVLTRDVMLSSIAGREWKWGPMQADHVARRVDNQLFCMLEGPRVYEDPQGRAFLTAYPGDILLMPVGTAYTTYPTSPEGNWGIGILFNLKDDQGRELLLDDTVRLVARDENRRYAARMRQLVGYVLQGGFSPLKAKALLYELLYSVATDGALSQRSPRLESILPAVRYMENNLQSAVSVDALAALCFMSKSTFHRRFQAEFHISPTAWHLDARIQKSRELLLSGLYSVEQVAEIMGFCDTCYFSRMFYKRTGQHAGALRPRRERP